MAWACRSRPAAVREPRAHVPSSLDIRGRPEGRRRRIPRRTRGVSEQRASRPRSLRPASRDLGSPAPHGRVHPSRSPRAMELLDPEPLDRVPVRTRDRESPPAVARKWRSTFIQAGAGLDADGSTSHEATCVRAVHAVTISSCTASRSLRICACRPRFRGPAGLGRGSMIAVTRLGAGSALRRIR